MGIIGSTSSIENQTRRVLIKNLDQQMKQAAISQAYTGPGVYGPGVYGSQAGVYGSETF